MEEEVGGVMSTVQAWATVLLGPPGGAAGGGVVLLQGGSLLRAGGRDCWEIMELLLFTFTQIIIIIIL